MNRVEILSRFRHLRVVPVIVIDNPESAPALGHALADGGLPCAEVTFRTAGAKEALARMAAECPDILVGAGTVLTPAQVKEAMDAGAQFIVAPGLNPRVVEYCLENSIPVFPGVATPTEIETALSLGLDVLKVFPIESLGGLPYLKAMSAPYTGIEFLPTGGITLQNLATYLSFPKIVSCGGSWIAPTDLIAAERFDRVTEEARKAVAVVKSLSTASAV